VLLRGAEEVAVAWAPQPGSQTAFLSCPVFECVYEGTRGPGKTDALLMDFLQHVGAGWGADWKGILFRRTYPELQDAIDKSLKWFPQIFPNASYNRSAHTWEFPAGEKLLFRYMERAQDYWAYHGHSYPWLGWEELTVWNDDTCYTSMFACARSARKGIPIKVRATTNPYGVGHNWVKARFRLPVTRGAVVGAIIRDARNRDGTLAPARVAVHGDIRENKVLLHSDPGYLGRLRASARNDAQLRAWVAGDWNIVAGGMFDDVWDPARHVVPDLPLRMIPVRWRLDRSYDHGQSKPFSVAWWAESNGEPFEYKGHVYGVRRGDLYRVAEWYGCAPEEPNVGLHMTATQIAQGIVERELDWGVRGRVLPGPADTTIFDDDPRGESSVAGDMQRAGVRWEKADKGPGSRVQGWQQLRKALIAGCNPRREERGVFVLERCAAFQRTVPVLPRDDANLDDVDTDAEDHPGDETRYRLRLRKRAVSGGDA
jgi:hypothetical protein